MEKREWEFRPSKLDAYGRISRSRAGLPNGLGGARHNATVAWGSLGSKIWVMTRPEGSQTSGQACSQAARHMTTGCFRVAGPEARAPGFGRAPTAGIRNVDARWDVMDNEACCETDRRHQGGGKH